MSSPAESNATGKEFTISRTFDAPRDLVWKAYTEAEHMKRWWGPKGFTMLDLKMDLRPGGLCHYGMKSPDGKFEMWGKFIYREVVPQERLSFVVSFSDKDAGVARHPASPTWPLEVLNVMTLTEKDGKTTILLRGGPINATPEERATFEGAFAGMEQGFKGTLDQLETYLTEMQEANVGAHEILSTRVFDVPRARLWKAWSTPEHLARWWGPNGFTNTFHTFDFVPGGRWEFIMRGPDGRDYPNESVFVEITAPERIVFDHVCPPHFRARFDFVEQGTKTRLVFRMTFESVDVREALKGIVIPSNEQNFDRLEAELARMG